MGIEPMSNNDIQKPSTSVVYVLWRYKEQEHRQPNSLTVASRALRRVAEAGQHARVLMMTPVLIYQESISRRAAAG